MKKRFIIIPILIAVIFIVCLLFGKDIANKILLQETAITYSREEERTVTLKKGDYVLFGEYLDEPILWLVADTENGKPLLQTEHIITFKSFDASGDGEADIKKLGSSDFEKSSLKAWLNSSEKVNYIGSAPSKENVFSGKNAYSDEKGFLSEENFTEVQKNLISDQGVFILSKEQIKKLFPEELRVKTATKSAILQDESSYIFTSSRGVWYWTSTPSDTNRTSVATITSSGGFYRASAFDGVTGVCPAVYLKDGKAVSVWGNGSLDKPYAITEGAQ
ncbi:MAG: hypothetical protein IJZ57_08385 [Clostridia bacterium]|nr:hypothetical protein [Clostridia bacterium]